ncbi:MAG: TlpA family protein disulfide reductase [Bacillota bacterium]
MNPLFRLFLLMSLTAILASCSEVLSENRGTSAPSFELTDLNGTIHHLDDYKGKKVYIHFWASWCSICLAGMTDLEELNDSTEDFTVLTIVSPGTHAEKNVNEFKAWFASFEYDKNFIVLLDEGAEVYERFEMDGYPSSIWIGSDGRIAEKRIGHVTNSEILELMNSIR